MPIPLLLALLSVSAAVRFGEVIISLNAQIFLKSFRKEFENSTSRGTREVQRWTSLFFVFPSRTASFSSPNKINCDLVAGGIKKKSSEKSLLLAEREGFEPPVQLPVHRISSAARSTTPASFQCVLRVQMYKFIF